MLNKKICVFDFETDGVNPEVCSPVQLASVMVDPVRLEIIEGSEFNIFCRPEVLEKDPNYKYTTDIIEFHSKVRGCSQEDIYKDWQQYPSQELAWSSFVSYLEKYHCAGRKKKNIFTAPIAAGYNIHKFDLKIINRLSKKYKTLDPKEETTSLFYPRDVLDIMNLIFYWFENSSDLKNYSLDTLRDYFGISKDGAHDALKDVKDCAKILIRFLRLHRRLSDKINFKDAFVNEN